MSDGTSIEWADASWNPIRARRYDPEAKDLGPSSVGWACTKVSPGCAHCYAATLNKRLGTGLDYTVRALDYVEMFLDEAVLAAPLRWRKQRRVFVCSMTDLFGEWVPDAWLDRIFAVMALAPQHTFLVLTKRAERMHRWFSDPGGVVPAIDGLLAEHTPDSALKTWPLPNVWLGVSAEEQALADERIPWLLRTPAAVRWISAEPLIGPIDFSACLPVHTSGGVEFEPWPNWIVVGGESGPGHRVMDPAWLLSIAQQCAVAEIPLFVKQDSGPRPGQWGRIPDHLRIRDYPTGARA